jgi:hypothetical protein
MFEKNYFQAIAASLSLMTLAGCANAVHDSLWKSSNAQLDQKIQVLQNENQQLVEKLATRTTLVSPSPSQYANSVSLTDIDGVDGTQDITDLAKLGVLDTTGGKFDPYKPITRAQYVCWLVATNNIYFANSPKNFIHPANAGTTPTFTDVPASYPGFKWIQGLANAGYIVGMDATHFLPDQPITREEMIAIKAQVDEGGPIASDAGLRTFIHVSDSDAIDTAYLGPVHEDYSVRTTNNIARIWGNTKVFHPKQALTRAEAVMSLSKIGSAGDRHATVAECLTKSNG